MTENQLNKIAERIYKYQRKIDELMSILWEEDEQFASETLEELSERKGV